MSSAVASSDPVVTLVSVPDAAFSAALSFAVGLGIHWPALRSISPGPEGSQTVLRSIKS